MIRIRIHSSYHRNDDTNRVKYNRYTENGDFIHKNLYLTRESEPYDYLIIINHPNPQSRHNINPEKTILIPKEPLSAKVGAASVKFAQRIGVANLLHYHDMRKYPMCTSWYMHKSKKELLELPPKSKELSAVISSLNKPFLPGHKLRLEFLDLMYSRFPGLDHYGLQEKKNHRWYQKRWDKSNGVFRGPIPDKSKGLIPYQYTFNCENCWEENYFTEKLIDGFISETLSFWDGCPNAEQYVNPEAFVRIDVRNPEESLQIMERTMRDREYHKRLPAIREMKRKYMEERNPLEIIRKIIEGTWDLKCL